MQNFDHNIGFWEKRHFFAKNCPKSQKIMIITSTQGTTIFCRNSNVEQQNVEIQMSNEKMSKLKCRLENVELLPNLTWPNKPNLAYLAIT
jgi:hypothetical protein